MRYEIWLAYDNERQRVHYEPRFWRRKAAVRRVEYKQAYYNGISGLLNTTPNLTYYVKDRWEKKCSTD